MAGKFLDILIQEQINPLWHDLDRPHLLPFVHAELQKLERDDFISQPGFCRENLPAPVS